MLGDISRNDAIRHNIKKFINTTPLDVVCAPNGVKSKHPNWTDKNCCKKKHPQLGPSEINPLSLRCRVSDSGAGGVPATYKPGNLRRWRPAQPVPPAPGGVGEKGKAVHIPSDQEAIMKEKFKLNQFNLMASDMISLNRSLTDVRLEGWVFLLTLSLSSLAVIHNGKCA